MLRFELRSTWWVLVGLVVGLGGCVQTPSRLTVRQTNASLDLAAYRERSPVVGEAVSLGEALALADEHNVDVWIARHERQVQEELATQSKLKLLPSLIAGQQTRHRTRLDAASSVSFETERESLEPSYSSPKTVRSFDVGVSWNLLDFGISFFRARQQAGRVMIAAERERRIRQNLALEVTRAYWRAVTARETARQAEALAAEMAANLERLRAEMDAQNIDAVEGLRRETRLLELQDELRRYRQTYLTAKTELATLMGLAPGAEFELAAPAIDALEVESAGYDLERLELEALYSRPELFEKDDEVAITRDEAHIALAKMFPNVSFLWSWNREDNPYLVFNEWNSVALQTTWDLLSIPRQLAEHEALQTQRELLERKRTAIAIAILTQLRLSLIELEEAQTQLGHSRLLAERHAALLAALEQAAVEGTTAGNDSLGQRMKYLKARARQRSALAEVKVAEARLCNTIGRDVPGVAESRVEHSNGHDVE